MKKVKEPSVAGQFYPKEETVLSNQLADFSEARKKDRNISSRLVIVPHAGYIYSGHLMSEGIGYLSDQLETIFIFAPSHHLSFKGLALSSYDSWKTPLGEIALNTPIIGELAGEPDLQILDEAFAPEHAAEVEVPFLQYQFGNGIRLVPILVGQASPIQIEKIIARYYDDPKIGFVISSDLSHFLTSANAQKVDALTAQMIETGDLTNFRHEQACGALGICGGILFARNRNFSFIRAGMYNSSETTGETDRVVGYGTWLLYEGSREEFLKRFYSDFILDLVQKTVAAGLRGKRPQLTGIRPLPAVFDELGASFVTLEIGGNLRGCIGSIEAYRPLLDDLVANANNSAFSDPRFTPLKKEEFDTLEFAVSLLGVPVQLKFENEEQMKEQIRPFKDGLIISDGPFRAVYLPSVWEQLPDKEQFIRQLKIKAGMAPNHFSKTFEARVFSTEYITGPARPLADFPDSGPEDNNSGTKYIWRGGFGW